MARAGGAGVGGRMPSAGGHVRASWPDRHGSGCTAFPKRVPEPGSLGNMAARRQIGPPREAESASRQLRERRIDALASRQQRLITFAQLLELGLSSSAIAKRASGGRLHRLHRGVFAIHPPPCTRHQRWLAAVLACGPGALLSDGCAAALMGISDFVPRAAQISLPSGRGRSRPGIEVHRRPIDPRDVRRSHFIPCTSAARALIDLAPSTSEAALERMMVAAESLRLLNRRRLGELAEERRGRPGVHKLASLLALEPGADALMARGRVPADLPISPRGPPAGQPSDRRARPGGATGGRLRLARAAPRRRGRLPALPRRLASGQRRSRPRPAPRPCGLAQPPLRPPPAGRGPRASAQRLRLLIDVRVRELSRLSSLTTPGGVRSRKRSVQRPPAVSRPMTQS